MPTEDQKTENAHDSPQIEAQSNGHKNFGHWMPLILIVFLSLLLRHTWIVSVIERDEGGIALATLQWMNGFLPYVHSPNNAGPLAYVVYLFSTQLFGPNIIAIRSVNNLFFFFSIIVLYLFVKKWFGERTALVSCLFYGVFMNAPIYEGQLALTSSLSASFILFSLYFCNKYLESNSNRNLFYASILMACASLLKISAALCVILLIVTTRIGLLHRQKLSGRKQSYHKKKNSGSTVLTALTGFSIPILIFSMYFWINGGLFSMLDVLIIQSFFSHLRTIEGDALIWITLNAVIQGLPLWIFGTCGFVISVLRRAKYDAFLTGWLLCAIGMALFPPNYGHRYIFLVAPASILAGISFCVFAAKLGTRRPHKVKSTLFITFLILVVSAVPAIHFQRQQYPQYHMDFSLSDSRWMYADADSYNTQMLLSEYLRSNTPYGEEVLIHGWAPEIYYLSGMMPPSVYAWTAPPAEVPPDEYSRLVEHVKNQTFYHIVFFASNITTLRHRIHDPIVRNALLYYFYIHHIGNALIFCKYDSTGQFIRYSFIDNFISASKECVVNGLTRSTEEYFKSKPILIPRSSCLRIQKEERDVIWHHPIRDVESKICYSLFIPENSTLKFGLGFDPAVWEQVGDGVRFDVVVEDGNNTENIFSHYINPKRVLEDRTWHDFKLDLGGYANRNVRLCFITSPGPNNHDGYDWSVWSNPLLLRNT